MRGAIFSIVSMTLAVSVGLAHAQGSAADAIAQKFAVEEAKPAKPVPSKPAAPQATQRVTQAQPAAVDRAKEEREMLEAARAEAEARRAQEKTTAAAPETAQTPPAAPAKANPPPVPAQANAAATPAPGTASSGGKSINASVLIVLTHLGDADASLGKTFDPIVCSGETCFISTGANSDAKTVSRAEALSTKNSMTAGAGACAGSAKCAFRGVKADEGGELQIIDLGLVRHDRKAVIEAKLDTTCGLDEGDLICNKPQTSPDYRIWMVPEALAANAGGAKIEAALNAELPEENVTLETDK